MSGALHFAGCAAGIVCSFLVWGLLQERLASSEYVRASDGRPERFDNTPALNSALALACVLTALCAERDGLRPLRPDARFAVVALSNTLASPCGYKALEYIHFPLLVVAKASKLLPIMAVGALLHGRRYSARQCAAAVCLALGVSAFSLSADAAADLLGARGQRLATGLGLVALNLALDGYTNAKQDALYAAHRPSPWRMMLQVNLWQLLFLGAWQAGTAALQFEGSALQRAAAFAAHHPQILQHLALFGLCGALGQLFIFLTIARYGSLACTTVCVLRKFTTVLLSIVFFEHVMTERQWVGLGLVFAGLGMSVFGGKSGVGGGRKAKAA